MPAIVARLILSIVVMLMGPVLYPICYIALTMTPRYFSNEAAFLCCDLAVAVVVVLAWLALWFREVRWTSGRIAKTAMALSLATLVAMVIGVLAGGPDGTTGAIIGGMVWGLCWFGFTPMVWRETTAERAQRLRGHGVAAVACPACGYDLTGLREAKCPECGASYTVDQLVAAVLEQRSPVGEGAGAVAGGRAE